MTHRRLVLFNLHTSKRMVFLHAPSGRAQLVCTCSAAAAGMTNMCMGADHDRHMACMHVVEVVSLNGCVLLSCTPAAGQAHICEHTRTEVPAAQC